MSLLAIYIVGALLFLLVSLIIVDEYGLADDVQIRLFTYYIAFAVAFVWPFTLVVILVCGLMYVMNKGARWIRRIFRKKWPGRQ